MPGRTAPTHAYIHIPFCLRKCHYCDFYSVAPEEGREALMARYTEALLCEMRAEAAARPNPAPLETLYLGGGTPTCLPLPALSRIVETVEAYFGFTDDPEITVEMNPDTLTEESFTTLRAAGVNRLSVGVQSLDNDRLAALGRTHSAEQALTVLEAAVHAGFDRISADIMLGLQGQTEAEVRRTLDTLADLGVGHLSFYSLILEPGTPLEAMVRRGEMVLPGEETERRLYHTAVEAADRRGLVLYEISNAARPGQEARHNTAYWTGASYYGWGPAAASYVDGWRRENIRSLPRYLEIYGSDGAGAHAAAETSTFISDDERMTEYLIFGLRRTAGISDEEAEELLGRPVPREARAVLDRHVTGGLLYRDRPGHWAYTRRGLDLADTVARDLI